MDTLGESNVVELFSSTLERAVIQKFGSSQSFMKGNFAGKADTIFADFFAGLPFSNILIEFKDTENDGKTEKRKPLRTKLCQSLDAKLYRLSLGCHFFGWGNGHQSENLSILLSEYVPKVCPILGGASVQLRAPEIMKVQPFLSEMFAGSIGLDIPEFVAYLEFLAKLPKDSTGPDPIGSAHIPFPALLLSYNDQDGVVNTPIHTVADLEKSARLLNSYVASTPPPPGSANGAPPNDDYDSSYGAGGGMF